MDKCRLCLNYRSNLKCVFDTQNGTSFADMVTSIANVKISKGDGITDQICRGCRRKTTELYEFKIQIERSYYMALQENCHLKRINFSNIYDIQFSIEISESDCKPIPIHITENLMNNSVEAFNYNDIIIKKVPVDEKKTLSVIDFLKSIETVPENECNDDDYGFEVDVDYDPDFKCHQSSKPKKQYKKKKKKEWMLLSEPVKPVDLTDYKPVYFRSPRAKTDQNSRKRLHICPYCGKMTRSIQSHLVHHKGEKKFKGDKCTNAFVSIGSLNNHVKRCHAPKDVKCDKCVATFTCEQALQSHMIRHSHERKHVCEVCNKAFKLKCHLLRHIQLVHNFGLKPFKCELCPDTFNSKYGLNHHMRVHTGERPYKCEICSQPYSYKHDFNRHCLKKHGVCFKRRSVNVMNEEVLVQERILMRDLMLRVNGILKDDKPINPFEGPQAAQAFEQAIIAIQSGKVAVDLQF